MAEAELAPAPIPLGLLRPPAGLREVVLRYGEPAFRARQLHRWLFRRGVAEPEAMTDLPASLRERLRAQAGAERLQVQQTRRGADGTIKALLRLEGAGRPVGVEAVLMPQGRRLTVCVSTQAGCAVGCPFCATGRMGLLRQLSPAEIAGQVLWARRTAGRWPTHVVFMGMGEPLANYPAVRAAIDLIRAPQGFGIGQRRLTLSTAGHVPGIRRLAAEAHLQVGLAVSLHAADRALRERLVPLERAYPLDELLAACRQYAEATRRRVTFEYVLLKGVNDDLAQARLLARRLQGMLCHVNVIPYNPVPGLPFQRPQPGRVARFARQLQELGLAVTVRWSRGVDIEAACGQLGARPAVAAGAQAAEPGCGGGSVPWR